MSDELKKYNWSEWDAFPDPRKGESITAPFGYGLYQLKNVSTGEFILFGVGNNCARRMTSLLPAPLGRGTRNNMAKREYLLENIASIAYRTVSFLSKEEMLFAEQEIKKINAHKFNT